MNLHFSKYHGTGNDFIMIDSTAANDFRLSSLQISQLCDRRFGIGADGIILIYNHSKYSFKMDYFNSDGTQSFCGNGARCAVQFAYSLGMFDEIASFEAIDGQHTATKENEFIAIKMNDVKQIEKHDMAYVIDTGSPHYIKFVKDLNSENIVKYGKKIRYNTQYKKEGINVNLVEILGDNKLKMLTYERGVEDETYSCGTGATAVALAYADMNNKKDFDLKIKVKGGELSVKGKNNANGFNSIVLIGPAEKTFDGTVVI